MREDVIVMNANLDANYMNANFHEYFFHAYSILTLFGPNSFFVVFRDITSFGSFRLPTHRRDAHMNFFDDPFLK